MVSHRCTYCSAPEQVVVNRCLDRWQAWRMSVLDLHRVPNRCLAIWSLRRVFTPYVSRPPMGDGSELSVQRWDGLSWFVMSKTWLWFHMVILCRLMTKVLCSLNGQNYPGLPCVLPTGCDERCLACYCITQYWILWGVASPSIRLSLQVFLPLFPPKIGVLLGKEVQTSGVHHNGAIYHAIFLAVCWVVRCTVLETVVDPVCSVVKCRFLPEWDWVGLRVPLMAENGLKHHFPH